MSICIGKVLYTLTVDITFQIVPYLWFTMKAHLVYKTVGWKLLPLLLVLSCTKNDGTALKEASVDLATSSNDEVLFIGNSHTYYNSGIAYHLGRFRSNDDLAYKALIVESSFGGFSLEDHLKNATTMSKIAERD